MPRGRLLLVPLLSLLWGLNWPAVKFALAELGPWTLRACALLLASLVLVGVALIRGGSLRVPPGDWWRVIVPGLTAIALPNVLIAYAQLSAPTSRTAVVGFTMPIWATVLAFAFLGEELDSRRIAGLALGCTGLACLAWPLLLAGEFSVGLWYALASAMVWAAGTTLMKRFPLDAPAMTFATWQLVIGALGVTAGMLVFEGLPSWRPLSPRTVVAFTYHALLGQALATVLWFEVVTKVPASIAALGTLSVPAIGVGTAMLLLGDCPTGADYVGLILIMSASAVVILPAPKWRARRGPP